MFSTLRTRFGIPGVISVMALVFAMFGGAYAASNSSGGGKATASAKAKKGPRGPKGAAGPQGPAGPAGAAGPKGDAGAAGAPGTSAKAVSFSGSIGGCNEGGVEVQSTSAPTFVCNGEEGEQGTPGENGSPWTAGGTLPPNQTETGAYSLDSESGSGSFSGYAATSISFPIPLAAEIGASNTIYVPELPFSPPAPEDCQNPDHTGAASVSNPEAKPGFLCVFEGQRTFMETEMIFYKPSGASEGAGVSGATLLQHPADPDNPTEPEAHSTGSWAVTAP
jgi:hypothetical protein